MAARTQAGTRHVFPSSFIRTMTVGSGMGPDLLTLPGSRQAAGGDFHPALKTHRPDRR